MMRKFLISGGILFLMMITSVFAKGASTTIDDIISKMKIELNLTDNQVIAIKPIVKKSVLKRQELLASLEGESIVNKKSVKIAMRKIRDEENQQLSQILNQEQMDKRIQKQHVRESLNKDQIDFSETLSEATALTPQGGSLQF